MAIYMWREVTPITTAWIYHNASLWLISLSSDGSTRYTIADKNLWATTVYNYWDTLSAANCWKYYQRWNNYWFPFSWSVTTSSSQVNASSYWPWNYYNSSTFIKHYQWDSSWNTNLRWDTTNTNAARKWPCDSWWHIPSKNEFETNIINKWVTILAWTMYTSDGSNKFCTYMYMPRMWYRDYSSSNVTSSWTSWKFWCSSNRDVIIFNTSTLSVWADNRWNWFPIRPFKNEAVQPDSSRTKLY